ncbi:uncharacterized protein BYT42DRAFT_72836 [Radiomyces spectabilis]|uniref:uncharacterized protein n=1 Tax=Radiomyces spectabilis TaxID=64574 RepID=UPI00221FAAC0|nr:uncharacterized protein BYT42DRAFT_72836 [Radiomyces spectabilis]KAI8371550.1 hypothetical protein BYT42DRAFT_72836 [Radiomyces spectabilis]
MCQRHERRRQLLVSVGAFLGIDGTVSASQLNSDKKFRALSDQYYGTDENHGSIRQEICRYLRQHEEEYKFFVEDDQSFDHHVSCMENDGTFGGNMELTVFAKCKSVDIKVYQPGLIYVISGNEEEETNNDEKDAEGKQTLHIAYHSWEHYSSIRNIDGPFSGPPEIKSTRIENPEAASAGNNNDDDEDDDEDMDSKEKVVLTACPGTHIRKIRRLLRKYKGNPNAVIDALYETTEDPPQEETTATATATLESNTSVIESEATTDPDPPHKESADEETPREPTAEPATSDETATNEASVPVESSQATEVDQAEPSEEPKKTKKKPKRLTARERKLQAKIRQKEQKLAKKRGASRPQEPSIPTEAMKELYI